MVGIPLLQYQFYLTVIKQCNIMVIVASYFQAQQRWWYNLTAPRSFFCDCPSIICQQFPNVLWTQSQKRRSPGILTMNDKMLTLYDHTLFSRAHVLQPRLCWTLSPLSRKCGQPHRCFLPEYRAWWPQLSAWRSQTTRKLPLAIVSGPIAAM